MAGVAKEGTHVVGGPPAPLARLDAVALGHCGQLALPLDDFSKRGISTFRRASAPASRCNVLFNLSFDISSRKRFLCHNSLVCAFVRDLISADVPLMTT